MQFYNFLKVQCSALKSLINDTFEKIQMPMSFAQRTKLCHRLSMTRLLQYVLVNCLQEWGSFEVFI